MVSSHSIRTTIDADFQLVAAIATTLKADYAAAQEDPWLESPFAWLRSLPPATKGSIGVQLVAGWCAAKGLDVSNSRDSEADKIIAGLRIEVKFSLRWANGTYLFQQIRDQNFEHVICLGLSPLEAHAWVVPKAVLVRYATPQHTGRRGKDTLWLRVTPSAPHSWQSEFGGSLSEAFEVLKRAAKVR